MHSWVVITLPLRCSPATTVPGLGQAQEEARVAKPNESGTSTQAPPEESTRASPGGSALHPASPLPLPGGREKICCLTSHQRQLGGGTPAESHPAWASPLPPSSSKPGSPIKFC